jgi:hypothetical protein
MSDIDWSKAPEGFPVWLEYDHLALEGDEERQSLGGEWVAEQCDRYITTKRTFWSKPEEGYYKVHYKPNTWNGAGLPPVGMACELCIDHCDIWAKAEILCIGKMCVFFRSLDCASGSEAAISITRVKFRPIRTPERIAAEEREKAIHQAICDIEEKVARWNTTIDCTAAIKATIEAMVSEGYRKQEPQS